MHKTFGSIKEYVKHRGLPLIPINANDVSLLRDPTNFYEVILEKCRSSSSRIVLSTLYLGTDTKESLLVNSIYSNLINNNHLDVLVALDANRSRRIDYSGRSSVSMLEKLEAFPISVNLVDTSRNLLISKILPLPSRWLEVLSTYHAKALVFDDDVVLTGANLSSIYFEKRQDRYMLLKNSKQLSNYIYGFIQKLRCDISSIKDTLRSYNCQFVEQLTQSGTREGTDCDSFIVPLVQYKSAGLAEKEEFLCFLGSLIHDESRVHLSSGYFNPSSVIEGLRVDSVIAPSEQSNGFFGGKGILSQIPKLYSAIHLDYIRSHPECKFYSYNRPDWSFHGKGLWVEGIQGLYIHLIGSSNFNQRSANRDLELEFLLLTSNPSLLACLREERHNLWSESIELRPSSFSGINLLQSKLARLLRPIL